MPQHKIGDVIHRLSDFIVLELLDEELPMAIDKDEPLLTEVVDSVAAVQLAAYIEEEYAVCFKPEDYTAENFHSLENLAKFVCGQ